MFVVFILAIFIVSYLIFTIIYYFYDKIGPVGLVVA